MGGKIMLLQRGRTSRRQNRHKIAALALAGMMMVSFVTAGATTARADTAAGTKAAITVTNIDAADNAALKAYKIVGKDANGNWSPVIAGSIADVTKPTAAEITALAGKTDQLGTGIELTTTDHKTYSKGDLDFGTYLVLVEQNDGVKNIYNPMIVSINDDKGNAQAGSVDAAGNFITTDGTTAFAKKSPVDITKKVTNSDQDNEKGSTLTGTGTTDASHESGAAVTEANFQIDTTVPYYSDAYTTVTFDVSDTVSEGLDAPEDIKVSVGGTEVAASADKYTLTQNGKSFKVSFASAYIKANPNQKVTVTYKSKLNEKATSGFDANTNKATLRYSNKPGTDTKTKEDKTYHYTFDIDGNIFGTMKGEEIRKVGVDAVSGETIIERKENSSNSPLANAVFQLKKGDTVIAEAATDAKGLMKFTQLQAGEYTLVEKTAPAGYAKDSREIPVKIAANLNDDGTLKDYSVTINNQLTTTYTANYEGTEVKSVDQTGKQADFVDYKLGQLPSTGGWGTRMLTIFSISAIALASVLVVTNRRKKGNIR